MRAFRFRPGNAQQPLLILLKVPLSYVIWYTQIVQEAQSKEVVKMTKLLEKAFDEALRLSEGDQDLLASWILDELKSEKKWREMLKGSEDILIELANEALAAKGEGKSTVLRSELL